MPAPNRTVADPALVDGPHRSRQHELLGCDEQALRDLLALPLAQIEQVWSREPFDALRARALAVKELMVLRGMTDRRAAVTAFVAHKAAQCAQLAGAAEGAA